jgi:hypothetical protein
MGKLLTTDAFVSRARKKHGDRYDYSKSVYVTTRTKIEIICSKHGSFMQLPHCHYIGGCGKCYTDETFMDTSKFIVCGNAKHGDLYDYSEVVYRSWVEKVKIICRKHGPFLQTSNQHLNRGQGCVKCGAEKSANHNRLTTSEFIIRAKKKHGDVYDYRNVVYGTNQNTKVKIICRKHGPFLQKAGCHIYGQGCPVCKASHGEKRISLHLTNNGISFESEKNFPDMRYKNPLFFDFYLPDFNLAVEFDGIQHFKAVKRFGGKSSFKQTQIRDKIKNEFCQEKGIHLLRIRYDEIDDTEKLIESFVNTIN